MMIKFPSHLSPTDRTALEAYLARIHKRYADRLLGIVLFGPKARGEADAESDIDLLLVLDDPSGDLNPELRAVAADVSHAHGVTISPRPVDRDRWSRARCKNISLYLAVTSEGIQLFP